MKLKEGKIYKLTIVESKPEGRGKIKVDKKMRLLKKFTHHALFINNKGITSSYRYWDLERLLKGQEV